MKLKIKETNRKNQDQKEKFKKKYKITEKSLS